MSLMKKILFNFRIYILGVTVSLFVLDLVFIKDNYDFMFFLIMMFWILDVVNYKFNFKFNFVIGIILFALVPFTLMFKFNMLAEKISIWSYVFFILAIAQKFFLKSIIIHNER